MEYTVRISRDLKKYAKAVLLPERLMIGKG